MHPLVSKFGGIMHKGMVNTHNNWSQNLEEKYIKVLLGPSNTSDYPITIVVIPLIYIVVPLLPPCCYFCAP